MDKAGKFSDSAYCITSSLVTGNFMAEKQHSIEVLLLGLGVLHCSVEYRIQCATDGRLGMFLFPRRCNRRSRCLHHTATFQGCNDFARL